MIEQIYFHKIRAIFFLIIIIGYKKYSKKSMQKLLILQYCATLDAL